jgi:hypothetical protein
MAELDIAGYVGRPEDLSGDIADAIDLASDQDQITWLTDHGKRVAAIVPVDVADNGDLQSLIS